MTNEEMRIAIAKACKAKPVGDGFRDEDGVWHGLPPNYPQDLNACREMLRSLDKDGQFKERFNFVRHLQELTAANDNLSLNYTIWLCMDAEPRQICEAFLKVKGLWKE